MALSEPKSNPIRAAVLYENDAFREPLRAALAAAGAEIRGEFRISEVRAEDLAGIDASVLLVNLEPILTSKPSLLEALVNGAFPGAIVFNDSEATSQLNGADMARWARHLASKIQGGTGLPPVPERSFAAEPLEPSSPDREIELWLLCASIGGPEAVRAFLAALDPDPPFAFILVQHIGQEFIELMTNQMNQVSPITVRCALHGDSVQPGQVLVVPADSRFTITQQNRVQLAPAEAEATYSPCIDQVMVAAADRFGADANAIIFSGMSSDGVAGSTHVLERGGEVWVQDPETCVVSSIVEGALKTGKVGFTGTPQDLAARLNDRARMAADSLAG